MHTPSVRRSTRLALLLALLAATFAACASPTRHGGVERPPPWSSTWIARLALVRVVARDGTVTELRTPKLDHPAGEGRLQGEVLGPDGRARHVEIPVASVDHLLVSGADAQYDVDLAHEGASWFVTGVVIAGLVFLAVVTGIPFG